MPRAALTADEIDAFRDELVDAATRRFAAHGFGGVTLRGLAGDLGCSPMTPYRYFRDKAEIFTAVRVAAFGRFADGQEVAAASTDDALARLTALADAYLEFARDDPDGYRLMFELTQPTDGSTPELDAQAVRAWQPLRETASAVIDAGILAGDPDVLAHVVWAALHGAVALHLAGRLRLGCELEPLAATIMDTIIRGAAAPHDIPRKRAGGTRS